MEYQNARLGLILFSIYLVLYGGFVLINAFAAPLMEWTPIDGINLAIIYGFGLIISAFGLALIYGMLSSAEPQADGRSAQSSEGDDA